MASGYCSRHWDLLDSRERLPSAFHTLYLNNQKIQKKNPNRWIFDKNDQPIKSIISWSSKSERERKREREIDGFVNVISSCECKYGTIGSHVSIAQLGECADAAVIDGIPGDRSSCGSSSQRPHLVAWSSLWGICGLSSRCSTNSHANSSSCVCFEEKLSHQYFPCSPPFLFHEKKISTYSWWNRWSPWINGSFDSSFRRRRRRRRRTCTSTWPADAFC